MPVQLADGCRYGRFLYLDTDTYIGPCLVTYGEYCEAEVQLLRRLVNRNGIAVDAGANLGAITVPLSQAAGRVVALEPQPMMYRLLMGNLALNGCENVDAYPVGLSNEAGTMQFPQLTYEVKANFGGAYLEATNDPMRPSVPVVPLDRLELPSVQLIKLDVEGMEVEALRGAVDTIARCRPYLWVENDRVERSSELADVLTQLEYRFVEHRFPLFDRLGNWRQSRVDLFPGVVYVAQNLLCVPKELPDPDV